MFESTIPMDGTKEKSSFLKTAQGVAIATGVLAAGYGTFRMLRSRRADRNYEELAKKWLKQRLENLQTILDLTMEKADDIRDEVEKTLHRTLKMVRRAECLKPNVREQLHIAVDKMLLKMKLNVHKYLELKTDVQLQVLENFYNELRGWVFRIKSAEVELKAEA